MNELLNYIPLVLRQAGDSEEARQNVVLAAWTVLAGKEIRQISTALRVERKTLIIAVKNALWQRQLRTMSGEILFRLNSLLGAPVITTLEFVVNPDMIGANPSSPAEEVKFIAPEKYAARLVDDAAAIQNEELREAFLRAASRCLDRKFRNSP
jgi:hypothetical protein